MDVTEATTVRAVIDGEPYRGAVRGDTSLLEVLRDELGNPSVRLACGIGVCGACTVRVDGRVVSSCILPALAVDGAEVRTPRGAMEQRPSRVLEAFVDAEAFQCSYCIPAMALSVEACLEERPAATVDDVREYLSGNLCRCGSYPQVIEALTALVRARAASGDDESGAPR